MAAAPENQSKVHPYFGDRRRPRVLAHRGLVTADLQSVGVVENSVAALAAAHAEGVDFIETDCRVTADGHVVLFHDETLDRVLGDRRGVAEVTRRELAELLSERGGLAVLEDVLADFPETRFNIDVKSDDAAALTGRIAAQYHDRVLITAFSDDRRIAVLNAAGQTRPATGAGRALILQVVLASRLGFSRRVRRLLRNIDALQVPEKHGIIRIVTRRLIRTAHASGTEIHVWTVNDADDMRRLVDLGVDGIVTDRADVAMKTLHP